MSDDYVPLAERGWSDVEPIPQFDGDDPILPIMYSPQYRDAMDYFRAVMASGEKSKRVLDLTTAILEMNPSHYTVWQCRFKTLLAIDADMDAELEYMSEFARQNLKTYQVWHHRLLLIEELSPRDLSSEIEFVHRALIPDAKNYHTWAYFHWLYCHFNDLGRVTDDMWATELQWCESMLAQDGRNNSAWGWRWFLCMSRPDAPGLKDPKTEINYVLQQIHKIPHNASAWNYLRGVLRSTGTPRAQLLPALAPYMAGSVVAVPETDGGDWPRRTSPLDMDTPTPIAFALEFLADTLIEEKKKDDAGAVFGQLGEVDRMRAAYWAMRRSECV